MFRFVFVCRQNNSKVLGEFSLKFREYIEHGPEKRRINLGSDRLSLAKKNKKNWLNVRVKVGTHFTFTHATAGNTNISQSSVCRFQHDVAEVSTLLSTL